MLTRLRSPSSIVIGALGILLAVQLANRGLGFSSDSELHPFLPGDTFRGTLVEIDGDRSWPTAGCWVGFIMDPNCQACIRLAADKRETAARRAGAQPHYLFEGTPERVSQFAREYGLPTGSVLLLADRRGRPTSARRMGFVATPTRVVFTEDRVAADVRVSSEMPTDGELRRICIGDGENP